MSKRIVVFLILIVLLSSRVAQSLVFPEDEVYDREEFKIVFHYEYSGKIDEGEKYLKNLIDTTNDSELRAAALLFLGSRFTKDKEGRIRVARQIIREYPGTRYAYVAKLGIIGNECDYDFNCTVTKFDELNIEMGYPGVEDILSGKAEDFNPNIIPRNLRAPLKILYQAA